METDPVSCGDNIDAECRQIDAPTAIMAAQPDPNRVFA
jgi:hypothetical protein